MIFTNVRNILFYIPFPPPYTFNHNYAIVFKISSVPVGASAMRPSAASTSATTVRISWSSPQTPYGIIIRYEIYRYEASTDFGTPIKTKEVNGTILEATVRNLQPFVRFKFTVKACNSYACSEHSGGVYATTAVGGKLCVCVSDLFVGVLQVENLKIFVGLLKLEY